jgi:hypothetical protein
MYETRHVKGLQPQNSMSGDFKMGSYTKLAIKLASALMFLTTLAACGQEEKTPSHSELSAQSCNYSAYEACIIELSLMNSDDRGYLAKKIKCDMIWNRCN